MKSPTSKQRVLLLTNEKFVPSGPFEDLSGREAELKKTEYDVLGAMKSLGHEAECLGIGSEIGVIRQAVARWNPTVVFNVVEEFDGFPHFDQHVVSYLELLKQKYTGCNPRGLTLARDKALTKKILIYHRIDVPRFAVFRPNRRIVRQRHLSLPLFVKSLAEDASEGISQASLVRDDAKLEERVRFIHEKTNSPALAEEYIEGREIYVGVIGNDRLVAYPPWELTMDKLPEGVANIATDKAKWDPKYQRKMGLKTGPAQLDPAVAGALERLSKRIFRLLGLSGYARMDYRLRDDGRLFLLEANANPQIARKEDFADSAEHVGIGYESLLQKILTLGLGYQPRVV
jgi:D-alanine-D-alanine ligase